MSYEVGQKVRLNVTVTDENGTATDATMAVAVFREDGTQYSGVNVIDDPGAGNYHADVVLDAPGRLTWRFTASGAVIGVYTGQDYVRSAWTGVLSLKEAKKQLNKRLEDTTDDDELLDWIDAVTVALEKYTGPIVPRTVIETFTVAPLKRSITLRRRPVLSVTSVREFWGPGDIRNPSVFNDAGPSYADDAYLFDPSTSSLMRYSGGYATNWPVGHDNLTVTYVAGRSPIPQNIRLAAKELLSHLWRQSQITGGTSRPAPRGTGTGESLADRQGNEVEIPPRVMALIGFRRAPLLGG